MGGNISLGKKTCDIPSNLPHGKEITLDFLQKYWSKDITSLKVEQLMVVTRVVDGEGIEKADGGGASGPSIVRLRLTWADGQFSDEQPETAIAKTEILTKNPKFPLVQRLWFAKNKFYQVELQANERNFYHVNGKKAVANGYSMPKTYVSLRSHDAIKRPTDNQIIFWDKRVDFNTCIIMEDMSGFKSPPQQQNLPQDKVIAALENMAILHATYWDRMDEYEWTPSNKKLVKECAWLQRLILGMDTGNMFNKTQLTFHKDKALEKYIKDYTSTAPGRGTEVWKRFLGNDSEMPLTDPKCVEAFEALKVAMADEAVQKRIFENLTPLTMCHGDCHGWNHMFPTDSNSDSSRAVVAVDFGFVGEGRPAWDLAYFFAMSVDASNFKNEVAALKAYYAKLTSVSEQIGGKFNPSEYSYEEFETDFFCGGIAYAIKTVNNAGIFDTKALVVQANKKDGGKGESLSWNICSMGQRMCIRTKTYYENGVFDKIAGKKGATTINKLSAGSV